MIKGNEKTKVGRFMFNCQCGCEGSFAKEHLFVLDGKNYRKGHDPTPSPFPQTMQHTGPELAEKANELGETLFKFFKESSEKEVPVDVTFELMFAMSADLVRNQLQSHNQYLYADEEWDNLLDMLLRTKEKINRRRAKELRQK